MGLWDIIGELIWNGCCLFLFVTGEVMRWVLTLGRHRVRWWELQDMNVAWPSMLLGVLFWWGVGALVSWAAF